MAETALLANGAATSVTASRNCGTGATVDTKSKDARCAGGSATGEAQRPYHITKNSFEFGTISRHISA